MGVSEGGPGAGGGRLVVQEEGSLYKCGERAADWLKLKPDYFLSDREEFDVLVVATSFGTGRARGGRLWQYVCAVAEDPGPGAREPSVFRSFCRVGTGLSRKQHDLLEATPRPHTHIHTHSIRVIHPSHRSALSLEAHGGPRRRPPSGPSRLARPARPPPSLPPSLPPL